MASSNLAFQDQRLKTAVISAASSGANEIVAAVTGKKIKVWRIMFVTDGAVTVIFKDGTTALSGTMSFAANGSLVLDTTLDDPLYTTTAGNAFVATLGGAVGIRGTIWYTAAD